MEYFLFEYNSVRMWMQGLLDVLPSTRQTNYQGEKQMTLKQRFLNAICTGELGVEDDHGVVVKLKDFKQYFSDVRTDYINSFLPAAVIEIGQYSPTHTKYVFRISKGVYRVHVDAIAQHKAKMYGIPGDSSNNKVEEAYIYYQYSVMI